MDLAAWPEGVPHLSVVKRTFQRSRSGRDLTWLICLVRKFWALDRIEDSLLLGGDRRGVCGAVDGDGR